MSEIAELRDACPGDFMQPSGGAGISPPSTDLFVGKRFLEAFFYSNPDELGPEPAVKEDYSSHLKERVIEGELPFSTFHTTRETVNIAITSLGHGGSDPDGADDCLQTVRDSDLFEVHHCTSEEYASVVEDFLAFDDRGISIQEVVLARIAESEGVQHIATWDSDFARYDDRVTLYPRNYWES